ncbi:hypothetical protein C0389_06990 [bacterium]|nr:hypothetical protein [bacterium]
MAHIAIITINDRCCIGARVLSSIIERSGHKVSLVFFGEYDTRKYESTVGLDINGKKNYFAEEKILIDLMTEINPDVISFSFRSVSELIVTDLAQVLKKALPEKPILFGGIGATSNPNDCIEFADYLCEGEGDYTLVPFLDVMDTKTNLVPEDFISVPNLWINRDGKIVKTNRAKLVVDLDSVPFIDYTAKNKYSINHNTLIRDDGRYDNELGAYPLLSSRGCPYSCSYCHNSLVKDLYRGEKYCRRRSPESVIKELKNELQRNPKVQMISVYDDSFPDKKGWLDQFVPMYKKEIRLPYWCFVHPEFITEKNVQLLVESGANNVCVGCQSFSERTLKMYHRYTKLPLLKEAFRILKKFNLNVQIDLISFNPLETEDDRRATFTFLIELDKNTDFNSAPYQKWIPSISRLTLFPHTEMFELIAEKTKNTGEFTPAVKDPAQEAFWEMMYRLTFYDFLPKDKLVELSNNYDDFISKHSVSEVQYGIEYVIDKYAEQNNVQELTSILAQVMATALKYKSIGTTVPDTIILLDKLIEKNKEKIPDCPSIKSLILFVAEKLIEEKNLVEAENTLRYLINLDNRNVDALNDCAVVMILQQKNEEAKNILLDILEIDSENGNAIENLKYLEQQCIVSV